MASSCKRNCGLGREKAKARGARDWADRMIRDIRRGCHGPRRRGARRARSDAHCKSRPPQPAGAVYRRPAPLRRDVRTAPRASRPLKSPTVAAGAPCSMPELFHVDFADIMLTRRARPITASQRNSKLSFYFLGLMVVEAVQSERVSARNSLISGNLLGKIPENRPYGPFKSDFLQRILRFKPKLFNFKNRELSRT